MKVDAAAQVVERSEARPDEARVRRSALSGPVGPIGVCFSASAVTLIQCAAPPAKRRGGQPGLMTLRAALRVPLPGGIESDEVLAATYAGALQEAFESAPFRGNRLHVAVPSADCFIHHLRIPPVPEEEVPDSVRWEMEEACPWPQDETQVRFRVVGEVRERGDSRLEIQVIATRKATAERLARLLEGCGRTLEALEAAPWAMLRAAALMAPETSTPVEVVCADAHQALCAVLWEGAPACIRPLRPDETDLEGEVATCTAYISPFTGGQQASTRIHLGRIPGAADPFARLVRRGGQEDDFPGSPPDLEALTALGLALGETAEAPWRS